MTDQSRPRLGAGDVKISLVNDSGDYEEFTLKPSYLAARTLSAQAGGIMRVMQRVATDLDIEAVVQVISLGLGYGTQARRAPADLAERIWRTGISDDTGGLAERCVTYLRALAGGGRLPVDAGAEARDDPADPPPSA